MAQNIFTRFTELILEKRILEIENIMLQVPFVIFPHSVYAYSTNASKTIEIKDKYMYTSNGFTRFMIIDKMNKHYCINNSFWYWKWNSIEDFHQLKNNKKYFIKYYGFRIALFGIFSNIYCSASNEC